MGIENMRRWPMYIVFAVCILTLLSLFNSWSVESELRNRITEISIQVQDCSKQQTSCMEESLTLLEKKESLTAKVKELESSKLKIYGEIQDYKNKAARAETQANRTLVDVELCKTELQSLKNLQVSKSATLETLRLEKDTLTSQLGDKKKRIEELEKEVDRLKSLLTTKAAPNPPVSSKVTPELLPPKISPAINNLNNPINEPVLENAANEELEDNNVLNDGFDQQLQ